MLFLSIERDGEVVSKTELAWTNRVLKKIQPNRECDREGGWLVALKNRSSFCDHVIRALEKQSKETKEILYGFFAIEGGKLNYFGDEFEWYLTVV